ncbi:MAG: phosphoribosylformylglycinamidine cyclo-ligase [Candidatus Lokiarchaeota archaeon]|nr:phosphoribosylformylglycinamidine cyclo-ligase [Candidatus Lokiarchaeota archaeon]
MILKLDDEEYTYAKSGVNIKNQKEAHKIIGDLIAETYKFRKGKFGEVIGEYGHYAGLLDIGNDLCLAMHVDGVGTKVMVAEMLNKYDTIGIDLIAMHANDLICMGAEPVALEDYLAIEKVNNNIIYQIMKGLVDGAKEAEMAIIGGETAIMPDVIKGNKSGKGLDLSGMSIGVVNKNKIITGEKITFGDSIIGLKSSGIHSNGYTLARKAFFELANFSHHDPLPQSSGSSIGEELLKPTKIYVKPVLKVIEQLDDQIHGLAHITGGAFSKLHRLKVGKKKKIGFHINNPPKPANIFKQIQKITNLSHKELYKTFNMGIGFCIIASKESTEQILHICNNSNFSAIKIGTVNQQEHILIETKDNKKIKL